MAQLRMFADQEPPPVSAAVDVDRVRRKLAAFLAEACGAGAHGLPADRRRLIETVVPQMTRWLPEEEAERARQAFGQALSA